MKAATVTKRALSGLGSRLSTETVGRIRVAIGYLAVGEWIARNGWSDARRVESRGRVFAAMMEEVRDDDIVYMEFGVWRGASIRRWVEGVANPAAEFHGFDSFEGLPETFDAVYAAGHFDVGGRTPNIDDDRVHWHVGWFEETLPGFSVPGDKRLVITLDADLYSATKFVLDQLDPHIRPGTLIYFDELSRVDHEPAAFDDYRRASGKQFVPLAFENTLNTGAFICQ